MTDQERKAMEMALDALEDMAEFSPSRLERQISTLRQALAQPEQEPVAWYYADSDVEIHSVALSEDLDDDQKANCIPLYTAPPSKPWVSLTDDDRIEIFNSMDGGIYGFLKTWGWLNFSKELEAKLKEKNNGN